MIRLCEMCWGPITAGQYFAVMRSIEASDTQGRITWRELYLHTHDPDTGGCRIEIDKPEEVSG